MGIAPSYAIPKVLQRTGLSIDDVDLFEVSISMFWLIRRSISPLPDQ